jgi:AcrR family transcriptional regulator
MAELAVSRRERARAATIAEIKEAAFGLMAESGATDVRFTDIARVMGMTPPAMYRYYGDRDELLEDLITDSYEHLGACVAVARDACGPDDIPGRWYAVAAAYRTWARTESHRFALIFGKPVPGFVAAEDGPTTEAAKRAMSQLSALFVAAAHAGILERPLVTEAPAAIAECAHDKHPELDGIVAPESFQAMLQAWASLHGFVCLEAYGHLDWLGDDARDALFRSHVAMIARAAGIPAAS